jgi:hypothetical protein
MFDTLRDEHLGHDRMHHIDMSLIDQKWISDSEQTPCLERSGAFHVRHVHPVSILSPMVEIAILKTQILVSISVGLFVAHFLFYIFDNMLSAKYSRLACAAQ